MTHDQDQSVPNIENDMPELLQNQSATINQDELRETESPFQDVQDTVNSNETIFEEVSTYFKAAESISGMINRLQVNLDFNQF